MHGPEENVKVELTPSSRLALCFKSLGFRYVF